MATKQDTTEHRSTYVTRHIGMTRNCVSQARSSGSRGAPCRSEIQPVKACRPAGPFMRADLPIAGFALIEAANVEDAIEQVAKTPCAVAHGVVEIWPLER